MTSPSSRTHMRNFDGGASATPILGSSTRPQTPSTPLRVLGICLTMYLAFGKGFAYAGIPPIFVGEVLLGFVAICAVRPTMPVPRTAPALITLCLLTLGGIQVVYDILRGNVSTLETLRGFAIIYYSVFAFALYALLRRHESMTSRDDAMRLVTRWLQRATPFILGAVLFLALLLVLDLQSLPRWPGSEVPMLFTKATDISVALAALLPLAFDKASLLRKSLNDGTAIRLSVTRSPTTPRMRSSRLSSNAFGQHVPDWPTDEQHPRDR